MYYVPLLRRMGIPSLLLALLACPTSVQAGFTLPSTPTQFFGDFVDFVGDFNAWNASEQNAPLFLLVLTPESDRDEMFLLLFLFWLEEQSSGGPIGAELAWFGAAETLLKDLGLAGVFPTGNTRNSSNGSSLRNFIPPESDGLPNVGNSVSPSDNPTPSPLGDPVAAPEPTSLALIGVGGIGFLAFGVSQRRRRKRS